MYLFIVLLISQLFSFAVDGQSEPTMERKRPHPADDLDPDYEDVADQQNKRQRQLERDGMSQRSVRWHGICTVKGGGGLYKYVLQILHYSVWVFWLLVLRPYLPTIYNNYKNACTYMYFKI